MLPALVFVEGAAGFLGAVLGQVLGGAFDEGLDVFQGLDGAGGNAAVGATARHLDAAAGARARIEARGGDEGLGYRFGKEREMVRESELAGIGHLGDLGAVAVVIGIVEVVLREAAPLLLGRGKDLRQDQFSRDDVAGRAGDPVFVLVRKRPVKDRIAGGIEYEQVDGA